MRGYLGSLCTVTLIATEKALGSKVSLFNPYALAGCPLDDTPSASLDLLRSTCDVLLLTRIIIVEEEIPHTMSVVEGVLYSSGYRSAAN